MSYRELRNFCEQMRALGYPRIVSMENFRRPNFELVADILYWLALKYDPNTEISDNIDEERHRVEFIKQITTLFVSKARLKINPKKLYMADGYAVQEILKISTFLYKAQIATPAEEDEVHDFTLPQKLNNIKAHKVLAQEITDLGSRLYDQLGRETELRTYREKALSFLNNVSRGGTSQSEQSYIQQCIQDILKQQEQNITEMNKYVANLERDQKTLDEKIKRKSKELEQAEKRLKGMTSVKPAYQEEYDRLEYELEKIYQIYVEKFRNLDYLEHKLDIQNKKDEASEKNKEKERKKVGQIISANERLEIIGDDEGIDEGQLEAQLDRGDSRGDMMRQQQGAFMKVQAQAKKGGQPQFDDDDDGEDLEDLDDDQGDEDDDDGIENLEDEEDAEIEDDDF